MESEQKVSTSKSKLFVSSNTCLNLAAMLSEQFQIPLMEDLGIYLDVPLIHGEIKFKHFGFLVEKIRSKVHGWKRRTLSKVARLLLLNTSIVPTSSYVMQSIYITPIYESRKLAVSTINFSGVKMTRPSGCIP